MRWTEEELTRAVAASRSWRGVARELGAATNGGALRGIRRRAVELGLSTGHFTGQRRWTDAALREAIPKAESWADVGLLLGLSEGGEIRPRLRGHAVRLEIDFSHLEPPQADVSADLGGPTPMMLRFAAEPLAVAWFALRGIPVAVPSQPAAYDLQITLPDGVRRVQVKSTVHRGRYGSWMVGIGQRPYALDKTASRRPYDPDAFDYFFIVDGDGLMYLIPLKVLAGRTGICVGPYKNFVVGDASSFLKPALRAVPDTAEADLDVQGQ